MDKTRGESVCYLGGQSEGKEVVKYADQALRTRAPFISIAWSCLLENDRFPNGHLECVLKNRPQPVKI
jgi:hypothetical protein